MDGKTRDQQIAVVVFAIVVVVVSVVVTIFFSKSGANPWRGSDFAGYQNVTFTDAVLNCESETENLYGDRIKHLTMDNHSSYYDEKQFIYKIFFTLDLRSGSGSHSETSLNYVNCYIKGHNGRLARYDVLEHVDETVAPITESEPGLFGRAN